MPKKDMYIWFSCNFWNLRSVLRLLRLNIQIKLSRTAFSVGLKLKGGIKAVGNFFMVGGVSRTSTHHGWQTTKKLKKKHWLKRPKAVLQKTKFGPNYKWFRIPYSEFFLKILFLAYNFYIYSSTSSGEHHRRFIFLFSF